MTDETEPVHVHVVSTAVKTGPHTHNSNQGSFVPATVIAGALPVLVLPHAPKRYKAVLTVAGVAGDSAFLCASSSDAANGAGCVVLPGMVLHVSNTDEVWVGQGNGTSIIIGVYAEYCS